MPDNKYIVYEGSGVTADRAKADENGRHFPSYYATKEELNWKQSLLPSASKPGLVLSSTEQLNTFEWISLQEYATKDYVQLYGGKIDKIYVDDVLQPITNKEVRITLPKYKANLSELVNDIGFITLKDLPKQKTKLSEFSNDAGFITTNDLPEEKTKLSEFENDTTYITLQEVGVIPTNISLSLDPNTYVLSIALLDKNNNQVHTEKKIDLPLETMVVSGKYLSDTKEVELSLQNGTKVTFGIEDLIDGLVSSSLSINGKSLITDIELTAEDIKLTTGDSVQTELESLSRQVDIANTKINNKVNLTSVFEGEGIRVDTHSDSLTITNTRSHPVQVVFEPTNIDPSDYINDIITSTDNTDSKLYYVKQTSSLSEDTLRKVSDKFSSLKFNTDSIDAVGALPEPYSANGKITVQLEDSLKNPHTLTITLNTYSTLSRIQLDTTSIYSWGWKKTEITAEELTGIPGDYFIVTSINTNDNDPESIAPYADYISCVSALSCELKRILLEEDLPTPQEEQDPTVPEHVKKITQEDIDKWNEGGSGPTKLVGTLENPIVLLDLEDGDYIIYNYVKPSNYSSANIYAIIDYNSKVTNITDERLFTYVEISIKRDEGASFLRKYVILKDYNDISYYNAMPSGPLQTIERFGGASSNFIKTGYFAVFDTQTTISPNTLSISSFIKGYSGSDGYDNALTTSNTTKYTPTLDYHPATWKSVKDNTPVRTFEDIDAGVTKENVNYFLTNDKVGDENALFLCKSYRNSKPIIINQVCTKIEIDKGILNMSLPSELSETTTHYIRFYQCGSSGSTKGTYFFLRFKFSGSMISDIYWTNNYGTKTHYVYQNGDWVGTTTFDATIITQLGMTDYTYFKPQNYMTENSSTVDYYISPYIVTIVEGFSKEEIALKTALESAGLKTIEPNSRIYNLDTGLYKATAGTYLLYKGTELEDTIYISEDSIVQITDSNGIKGFTIQGHCGNYIIGSTDAHTGSYKSVDIAETPTLEESTKKGYLVGSSNTNSLNTNYADNKCYIVNGKVYSNNSEVINLSEEQTMENKTLVNPNMVSIKNGDAELILPTASGIIALKSDIEAAGGTVSIDTQVIDQIFEEVL